MQEAQHHHHHAAAPAPPSSAAAPKPEAPPPTASPAAAVAHAHGPPDTPGAKSDLIGVFRNSVAASTASTGSAVSSGAASSSSSAHHAAQAQLHHGHNASSRPPVARSPLAPTSPAAPVPPTPPARTANAGPNANGTANAPSSSTPASGGTAPVVPHHAHQHAAHPHQTVGSVSPNGVELLALAPSVPPALARPEWCLREFRVLEKLYTGYASKVYRAQCRRSGQLVVLKSYHMPSICALYQHQIRREVRLHASLGHENVVALHAAFKEGDLVVLVLEHCDGGDLFGLLQRYGGRLTEKVAVQLVLEPFLRVLNYMHGRGIVHRDIKPENILFSRQGATLKLADFGLAIDMREERAVTRAGTLDYMAPEILNCPYKNAPEENKDKPHLHYGPTVDSWAVGVLAYELLVGCPPFYDRSRDAVEARIRTQAPQFPSSLSDDARSFVRSALSKDPTVRPTILQLLNHPWVSAHRARRSMRAIAGVPSPCVAASSPTAADAQAIVEVPSSARAAAAAAAAALLQADKEREQAAAAVAGGKGKAPASPSAASLASGAAPATPQAEQQHQQQQPTTPLSVASSSAAAAAAAPASSRSPQFAGRPAPPCNSLPSLAISQSFSTGAVADGSAAAAAASGQQQQQQQQLARIREAALGTNDDEDEVMEALRPEHSAHSSPTLVADVRQLQLGPVAVGGRSAGCSPSASPSCGDRNGATSPRGWFARLLSPRAGKR
jgi:tRNA A-37 threonylcarbamoyl transferase component Bud32